jgi:hypothetical protein
VSPHRVFLADFSAVTTPPHARRDQYASTVSCIASFHGLIFASVFARRIFATSLA